MKALVLHPVFNLYERKGKVFCSSLQVADTFEKQHGHVLRNIEELNLSKIGEITNFFNDNFDRTHYEDTRGRKQPMYLMTRDGFSLLVMGYTGEKAMKFKIAYIQKFNAMENYINGQQAFKDEFPPFTRAIQDAHDEPQSFHFSNECNMIDRIVTGYSAKEFKEIHNILITERSIRGFLDEQQRKSIRLLQIEDIPLLYKGVKYKKRQTILTNFHKTRLSLGG